MNRLLRGTVAMIVYYVVAIVCIITHGTMCHQRNRARAARSVGISAIWIGLIWLIRRMRLSRTQLEVWGFVVIRRPSHLTVKSTRQIPFVECRTSVSLSIFQSLPLFDQVLLGWGIDLRLHIVCCISVLLRVGSSITIVLALQTIVLAKSKSINAKRLICANWYCDTHL